MKKVLIMPWILALILFCSTIKIKASEYKQYYTNGCTNCASRGSYTGISWTTSGQTLSNTNYTKNLYLTAVNDFKGHYDAGAREVYISVTYSNDDFGWWESDAQSTSATIQDLLMPDKSYTIRALYGRTTTAGSDYIDVFCKLVSDNGTFKTISCPLFEDYRYFKGLILVYTNSITAEMSYFFGFNRNLTMVYDTNTQINSSINEQTQQQEDNYNNFMNETQQYDDQQNTNISGVNETMQYEQAENQLIQSLDTNTSLVDEIVINPLASAFIWDIVGGLRNMNPAIIVLMTSMLGFGIVKLILNR